MKRVEKFIKLLFKLIKLVETIEKIFDWFNNILCMKLKRFNENLPATGKENDLNYRYNLNKEAFGEIMIE